jgi:tetratricopeptide (TPR) repeat protein
MFRCRATTCLMVGALIAGEIAVATVSDKIDADLRAGRFSSAQAEAWQLVHAEPRNPMGWTYLGLAEVCLRHPDQALEAFEHAVALNPNDARPYLNLALLYAERKDIDRALSSFEKGLALDDRNVSGFFNYGRLLTAKGRFPEAAKAFERVTQLNSIDAGAYTELSKLYLSMNAPDTAVRSGRRAVELAPNNLDAGLALAEALIAKHRDGEAAELLARVEYGNRNSAAFYYTFGITQMGLHSYERAIESLKRSIRLDPKFDLAHFILGTAFYARNEIDEAEACFRTATSLNPSNPLYYSYLVRIYGAKGPEYRQAAYEANAKLLALNPRDIDGRLRLAVWAKEEGDLKRARDILERVIADAPKSVSAHVLLATIYYRLKLREQAREQQDIVSTLQHEAPGANSAR